MNLKEIAKEIRDILSERQKELELTFEEDKHRYTMKDIDGTIRDDFPSVSKVMKLFYDDFPTEEMNWRLKQSKDTESKKRLDNHFMSVIWK